MVAACPHNILPMRLDAALVRRRGKTLAGPVDLTINANGFTVLIGPNGAGKTTLLRLMHGIERLSGGAVRWAVDEVQARSAQAYVFQTPIVMRRTVVENLMYPLHLSGLPRREAAPRARKACAEIGLAGRENLRAARLSGGEKQKLALARALIRAPQVLFLDEPCASLDGRSTREIEEILLGASARGTRIIMSTHDLGQARRLATEILFMHAGKLLEHGPADRFFQAPDSPEALAFLNGDILE